MIENGVSPVLLQAIVKSLIRFEREMVIKFTDNTVGFRYGVLPVLLHGINWLGWDNKMTYYFGNALIPTSLINLNLV